ncbi:protein disulfide-isomerase [Planctomycetales bacterium]|nr:protein disulfide-isomerase [Planctomycetales bacterium]
MALDPYSLCPGGREKKIRFCCPDMVKEIEQIERLFESNQTGSCLSFIESLEKNHPNCACLTAAKLTVFRTQERWVDALTLSKEFFAREPENPVAASEFALALAMTGSLKDALSEIIDAFERAKEGTAHSSVIAAALQIGSLLLMRGQVIAAVALGNRLKSFPTIQDQANALLYQASSVSNIPIQLRDMMFDQYCPDDFPAKPDFEEAVELLSLMRWKQGLAKLESLISYSPQWTNILRAVAAVHFWLLDEEKGMEYLQKFAAQQNTAFEDAVDAESARLFLRPSLLGDDMEASYAEYKINNAAEVQELLLSSPRFYKVNFDPALFVQNGMAVPIGAFLLLDKPFPAEDTEINYNTAASQIVSLMLFGKETDRDARIEIPRLLGNEREETERILQDVLGDKFIVPPVKTANSRQVSQTLACIKPRFCFTTKKTSPSPEMLQKMREEYFEKDFTEVFLKRSFGLLDGKTPVEAAALPEYKIRLSAIIEIFEHWLDESTGAEQTNKLRSRLNLPIHDIISVPDGSEEEQLSLLDELPVWRWHRLEVEKMPVSALTEGLQVVSVMKESRAAIRFAEEILNRPMNDMPPQSRVLAFDALILATQKIGQFENSLEWILKAKAEAAEQKISDAGWCLYEIPVRLELRQYSETDAVFQYLTEKYGNDDNVMRALNNLLIQLGLIHPDGTPAAEFAPPREAEPVAPPAGLWTPDSQQGQAAPSQKLWTPD